MSLGRSFMIDYCERDKNEYIRLNKIFGHGFNLAGFFQF